MSDQIQLDVRAAPWSPAADATPGEVFDYYDMPLAGELTQQGAKFIFQCLEGVVAGANVWLYAPVGEAELDELKTLDGRAFDEAMWRVMSTRTVTIAFAADDQIVAGGVLDKWTIRDQGLIEASRQWLTEAAERERDVASAL